MTEIRNLNKVKEVFEKLHNELSNIIVGQEEVIGQVLVAILCDGNVLLESLPGLAKTTMIKAISDMLDLDFSRIQSTPDLMPSDVVGTYLIEEEKGKKKFVFQKGPVFSNIVLVDEINRATPKTQSALLEAMQEKQVTVAGVKYNLEEPFFVLATQNPIEQEGTYPLPEAQLDRFMFSLNVDYPEFDDEVELLLQTTQDYQFKIDKVVTAKEIITLQNAIRHIVVPKSVAEYAVKLVKASRPNTSFAMEHTNKYLRWGAGPRACQYLALAGKVYAARDHRFNVAIDDINRATMPVLRHRIILNYRAEADGQSPEKIIDKIIDKI